MSYQDDVSKAVVDGFVDHARFYVKTYKGASPEDKAKFHSDVKKHEQSYFTRNISDSAKLLVAEYLEAHPAYLAKVEKMLTEMDHHNQRVGAFGDGRIETYGAHEAREIADVAREQAAALMGNALGSIFQGVFNMIYSDPAEAVLKAAPFVTFSNMVWAHGEALEARSHLAHDLAESFSGEKLEGLANELGRDEVQAAIDELGIGNDDPGNPWTNTGQVLGEERLEELQSSLGGEKVAEASDHREAPEPMPGFGGYREGEAKEILAGREPASKDSEVGSVMHTEPAETTVQSTHVPADSSLVTHPGDQSITDHSVPDHPSSHPTPGEQANTPADANFIDSSGQSIHIAADSSLVTHAGDQSITDHSVPEHPSSHPTPDEQANTPADANFTDSTGQSTHIVADSSSVVHAGEQSTTDQSIPDHPAPHPSHGEQANTPPDVDHSHP